MEVDRLDINDATQLVSDILERHKINSRDAHIVARHVVDAELRGYPGHGLRRIPGMMPTIRQMKHTTGQIPSRSERPGFVIFDGTGRLGIVAVHETVTMLASKLTNEAAIVFGLTGYSGTTGSIGVYANELASHGIVSLLMCSSEFGVAPHGSSRAVLGTNPIAIGFPGEPVSFCADVATAAWSYGSIKDAGRAGKQLPVGIVQTQAGEPSTDPNDADEGSQLPMAGHKGYALGLAVELLCGPLIGGKAGRDAVPGGDGFFGVLIRNDCARPAKDVNADQMALFEEIKRGPRIQDDVAIRIPGETSAKRQQACLYIDISKDLLQQLRQL